MLQGIFRALYFKGLGPEVLDTSGASGTATAANWVAGSGATLTNPSVGVLQNSCAIGDTSTQARQVTLTVGVRYLLQAEANGDGANGIPRAGDTSVTLWTGTNSTALQTVRVEFVATTTRLDLVTIGNGVTTDITQWRNISVKEVL